MNNDFSNEIEKFLEKLKTQLYQNKNYSYGLCAFVLLLVFAFPTFMLWAFCTTVVFIFVKGVILILKMINNR